MNDDKDTRPSITELKAEIERWPDTWTPDIDDPGTENARWTGKWHAIDRDGDGSEVESFSSDYDVDLARHLASLHNAAPTLLEISAAALALIEAHDSVAIGEAWHLACADARDRLRAVLSQVRP